MGAPAYKLTTWAEIQSLYSTTGSSAAVSDLSGATLTAFQLWVEYLATEEVFLFLGTRYKDLQSLSQCNLVRMWATILGCYQVSRRRGNPELFLTARDEVLEYLKLVQNGELSLQDVNTNTANQPSMQNYSADPRFAVNGIRIAHDGVQYSNTPNDKPRIPTFPNQ